MKLVAEMSLAVVGRLIASIISPKESADAAGAFAAYVHYTPQFLI
jgi:hypothetical protein